MKSNVLKNVLLLILATFLSTAALSANAFELKYKFDVVVDDLPDLIEPPGDGVFIVTVDDEVISHLTSRNPFSLQYLADAAQPYAEQTGKSITSLMKAAQTDITALKNNSKLTKDAFEKQKKKILDDLNAKYHEGVVSMQTSATGAILERWSALQGSQAELKKYNIKIGLQIAEGVFAIAKGVVFAVLSFGTDATSYIDIVKGIAKIYGAVSDALKDDKKASNDLAKVIGDVEGSLSKLKVSPSDNFAKKLYESWKANGQQNTLKEKIESLKPKIVKTRLQAGELSGVLNELLNKQELLKEIKTKNPNIEQEIQTQIEKTVEIGTIVTAADDLVKKAEHLIELLKEVKENGGNLTQEKITTALKEVKTSVSTYQERNEKLSKALEIGRKIWEAIK
jgi:hypothetical protein